MTMVSSEERINSINSPAILNQLLTSLCSSDIMLVGLLLKQSTTIYSRGKLTAALLCCVKCYQNLQSILSLPCNVCISVISLWLDQHI